MGADRERLPKTLPGVARDLGRVAGSGPGPTLICVGGIHGNEVAGILAIHRVLERLRPHGHLLRGDLVTLSGNRGALSEGRRYLLRDLNRSWTQENLREGRRTRPSSDPGEDREQRELKGALDKATAEARGPVYLLDLHTTSGPSVPFTAIMDRPANRAFALGLPVPLILGFGELVDGTFFGYLTGRGITSMVFEGGQHQDPRSVEASEAAIWLALTGAGLLSPGELPEVREAQRTLLELGRGLPPIMEIKHRHAVAAGDGFRMRPGFENFQTVRGGELLARDHLGEIRCPGRGRLLLPLYQSQGDDGFFLVREPDEARRFGAA